jgi:putative membrane protein
MGTSDASDDQEPDYRFTLANERTFLAWNRTALAMLAAGAVVTQLLPGLGPESLRYLLGVGLLLVALTLASTSYRRWVHVDEAIRHGRPLPRHRMPLVLAVVVGAATLLTLVLIVLD